ncbi:MAG TPA: hypothetical protein VMX17_06660 [Candidatus Glassbacteria bacterium]|nr:hypothetical protein [Candidatus Glassbacteria bacterium]
MESNKETCFTCAKYSNLHISKEEFCVHSHTMCNYPHPVPCVHYKRFPEYERIDHDNHVWKKSSTNYAHMNGVSWLGWCIKCGAEAAGGMPASNRCYDIVITKKYRTGGIYKKENSNVG